MNKGQQPQIPFGSGGPASTPPGYYQKGAYSGGGHHPNDNNYANAPSNFYFDDKSIRRQFICKVYSILMCQILLTLGLVTVTIFHEPTASYIRSQRSQLSTLAFIVAIGTLLALACCENVRRQSPANYILLFVFTVAQSFLLSVTVSMFYPGEVLTALGLTAFICFALTAFAFQTRIDFTVMAGVLLVAVIVLLFASIVAMFFPGKLFRLAIACAGAIIFSFHLILDTQLMIGGSHKYTISPEEYVFAALTIYVDVINIFLYILTIIGASGDD